VDGFPAAHIPRRVRLASMRRRSAGAHPKWKKTKRPGSLRNPGLWNSESGWVRVRRSSLPDGDDPRTRDDRATVRTAARSSTAAGRARTHTSRRGLWRCEGRSGCSR